MIPQDPIGNCLRTTRGLELQFELVWGPAVEERVLAGTSRNGHQGSLV